MLPVELWNLVVNAVYFLLRESIKKGQSRDNYIILLLIRNINVNGLM